MSDGNCAFDQADSKGGYSCLTRDRQDSEVAGGLACLQIYVRIQSDLAGELPMVQTPTPEREGRREYKV